MPEPRLPAMLERCVCRLAQLLEGAGPSALLVLRSTIQLSDPAVVEDEGIEPSTLGLQSQCSPAELIPLTWSVGGLRCARASHPGPPRPTPWRVGLSKPNSGEESVLSFQPDPCSCELVTRIDRVRWHEASRISRKEVIQPQVPLRLPCYDFTPVINPTVVGSFLCRLGYRLKVKPTPMV